MKPKKVRCTCARCQKVHYLPAASIDRSERFLCEGCDDKFISWQNARISSATATLDEFLLKRPA